MSAELSDSDCVWIAATYVARHQDLSDKETSEFVRAELLELASIGCEKERESFVAVSREIVSQMWWMA